MSRYPTPTKKQMTRIAADAERNDPAPDSEPGTIAALRSALEQVSTYVLAATWPKDTPMEAHRQEIITVLDEALTASSEPARIERDKIVAPWREALARVRDHID